MRLDKVLDLVFPNTEITLDWLNGDKEHFCQFRLSSNWRAKLSQFEQHEFSEWTVTKIVALDSDRLQFWVELLS